MCVAKILLSLRTANKQFHEITAGEIFSEVSKWLYNSKIYQYKKKIQSSESFTRNTLKCSYKKKTLFF